jgi:hypothetical protein
MHLHFSGDWLDLIMGYENSSLVTGALNNPKTAALRFDAFQDAVDFAAKRVESPEDFLSLYDLDFAKRYGDGELELVIELSSRTKGNNHHLIFNAIPNGRVGHLKEPSPMNGRTLANPCSSYGDSRLVLSGIRYFVECPQKLVASQVRLEPAKERLDLWRHILGPSKRISHLSHTSGEREGAVFGVGFSGGDGNSVRSVVESPSKVLSDVMRDVSNRFWEGYEELDLVNLMIRLLTIRLNHSSVGIGFLELDNFPLKILHQFFSPADLAV